MLSRKHGRITIPLNLRLHGFEMKTKVKQWKEEQVRTIFAKWLSQNHLQNMSNPIGDSSFQRRKEHPRMDDICCPYYPDFLVISKTRKNCNIAIETKGSRFRLPELLGQLLLYGIYYSEVWAVLPLEKAKRLANLKGLIQTKVPLEFEIFGVTEDSIYRFDAISNIFTKQVPMEVGLCLNC